jgi:hypothetical protein
MRFAGFRGDRYRNGGDALCLYFHFSPPCSRWSPISGPPRPI